MIEEGAGEHTFIFLKATEDKVAGSELRIDYGVAPAVSTR